MSSRWKDGARRCIEAAIRQAQTEGLDRAATIKRIDKAWSLGPRKNWPYEAWREVRKELIAVRLDGKPLTKKQPEGEAQRLRAAGEPGLFDEMPA